jgi:ubiquinone/menaquinone biosynthesis C-methylase UbiE
MDNELQDKKDRLQEVFTRTASSYADIRYFPIFGEWLVETAQIPERSRVLDVASGRGAVLFPAAERVGPGGRVVGTDLAQGMARETGAEIQRRGLTQAEAHQMDAEHLKFPDASFDFVLCGFSLQFFPHLDRALSEFRRVLKPAGRVVVTTWGDDDARWDWFQELRKSHGAVLKLGSQSLDDPDEIRKWFSQAGFMDVEISTKEMDMVYVNEEEWWNVEWSISGRAGLEKLSPEALEQFKAEAFRILQSQKQPDGYHYTLKAFCTSAGKV